MKRKNIFKILFIVLLGFVIIDPVFAAETKVTFVAKTGCEVFSDDMIDFMQMILDYIRIAGIALAVILQIKDYVKVIFASKDDANSKANKNLGVRLIAIGLLFLAPALVNFIITVANVNSYGTCNIF